MRGTLVILMFDPDYVVLVCSINIQFFLNPLFAPGTKSENKRWFFTTLHAQIHISVQQPEQILLSIRTYLISRFDPNFSFTCFGVC